MKNEDENPDLEDEEDEIGSDELLAADELRLPESANVLVRLHALRAWLNRRYAESEREVGSAALDLQTAMREAESVARPRRRSTQDNPLMQRAQLSLSQAQQRLSAYDEARALLENCVEHTTASERLLVEYYLSLEEMIQATNAPTSSLWLAVMANVLHRVEQVGTHGEAEE